MKGLGVWLRSPPHPHISPNLPDETNKKNRSVLDRVTKKKKLSGEKEKCFPETQPVSRTSKADANTEKTPRRGRKGLPCAEESVWASPSSVRQSKSRRGEDAHLVGVGGFEGGGLLDGLGEDTTTDDTSGGGTTGTGTADGGTRAGHGGGRGHVGGHGGHVLCEWR